MKFFLLSTLILCSNIQLILAQAPANDECTGAIAISLTTLGNTCTSSIGGNTANATQSSPNPACTSSLNDDDIWYSFQATGTGIVLRVFNATNNATGQTAQIGFALYRGTCPVSTTTIACNNLVTAGAGYIIINDLVPAETYYLRFWSASSTGFASFQFCVQETEAPVNNECANAIAISTQPEGSICNNIYQVNTTGASRSLPDPACTTFNDDDVWYAFVAGANGVRLNFTNAAQVLSNGNANIGYAVHETSCTGAVISCSPNIGVGVGSELIGGLVPANTYLLRLFSYATNVYTSFDFCLVDETIVSNDECANAVALTVTAGIASLPAYGSLLSATTSAGFTSPACTALSSTEDVWFKALVPASGSMIVQTAAALANINDLVMEAYSGNCNSLTFITCNDQGNPDPAPSADHASILLTGRLPGEIVFLRVLGKGTINNGPFVIAAWDPSITVPVSDAGNCLAVNSVTINSSNSNQYRWVPLLDGSGNIVAEIYADGNSPGLLTASVFANTAGTVQNANGKFYLDRQFSIVPQDTVPVKIRLYIKQEELQALQLADPLINDMQQLQVVVTSNACGQIRSAAVAVYYPDSAHVYNGDFYLELEMNTYGSLYIERKETVVPVTLQQFTATCKNGSVSVNWTTSLEVNSDSFIIERSSDGRIFETAGQVAAAGITTGASYSFLDPETASGKRWYRLMQTDIDGRRKYYRAAAVMCDNKPGFTIYPNPAGNTIKLSWHPDAHIRQINLFAADGRLMKVLSIAAGYLNAAVINISELPDGLYILQLQEKNGSVVTGKFLKKR